MHLLKIYICKDNRQNYRMLQFLYNISPYRIFSSSAISISEFPTKLMLH